MTSPQNRPTREEFLSGVMAHLKHVASLHGKLSVWRTPGTRYALLAGPPFDEFEGVVETVVVGIRNGSAPELPGEDTFLTVSVSDALVSVHFRPVDFTKGKAHIAKRNGLVRDTSMRSVRSMAPRLLDLAC